MKIPIYSIFFSFLLFSVSLFAQTPLVISKKLNWAESAIVHNPTGQQERLIWSFDGALFNALQPEWPVLMERLHPNDYRTRTKPIFWKNLFYSYY